ncbi:hypothetical protein Aph02nite_84730 [Actinoplanes philippinensis]|nr:hypothetical protein Aph02nite_84730 [Actinoplanes philippinensis]
MAGQIMFRTEDRFAHGSERDQTHNRSAWSEPWRQTFLPGRGFYSVSPPRYAESRHYAAGWDQQPAQYPNRVSPRVTDDWHALHFTGRSAAGIADGTTPRSRAKGLRPRPPTGGFRSRPPIDLPMTWRYAPRRASAQAETDSSSIS